MNELIKILERIADALELQNEFAALRNKEAERKAEQRAAKRAAELAAKGGTVPPQSSTEKKDEEKREERTKEESREEDRKDSSCINAHARDANVVPTSKTADSSSTGKKGGKKGGKKNTRFVPPTVEEVADYCRERGNAVNAEEWWAFYASKGWMVGKNKMVDWQRAIITWEVRRKQDKGDFTPPSIDDVRTFCRERGVSIDVDEWFNLHAANGWMVGKNKMVDWQAAVLSWEKLKKSKPAISPRRVVRADNAQIMNDEQAKRFGEELENASR